MNRFHHALKVYNDTKHLLVLAGELLARQPLQHLPDRLGGLGQHGKHGHPGSESADLLKPNKQK